MPVTCVAFARAVGGARCRTVAAAQTAAWSSRGGGRSWLRTAPAPRSLRVSATCAHTRARACVGSGKRRVRDACLRAPEGLRALVPRRPFSAAQPARGSRHVHAARSGVRCRHAERRRCVRHVAGTTPRGSRGRGAALHPSHTDTRARAVPHIAFWRELHGLATGAYFREGFAQGGVPDGFRLRSFSSDAAVLAARAAWLIYKGTIRHVPSCCPPAHGARALGADGLRSVTGRRRSGAATSVKYAAIEEPNVDAYRRRAALANEARKCAPRPHAPLLPLV